MATRALTPADLPGEAELRSFARAAAQLLVQRHTRAVGSRIVKRVAGVGIQHLDHRDYVAGDEVRHIDWRQTARRRRPTVRRFESESISQWTMLVDASSSMAVNGGGKWRAAQRAAAAMTYALLDLGHRVGVVAFGNGVIGECPGGRGASHYAAVVRLVAALQPAPSGQRSDLGACARRLHGAASVFIISDFLGAAEMRRDLAAILERCTSLHALQVTQAAELALATDGAVDLVDVETGVRMPAHADPDADAAAAAERAAMTQRLRRFCHRSGIAFTDWDVAIPWQQTLVRHLVRARSMC